MNHTNNSKVSGFTGAALVCTSQHQQCTDTQVPSLQKVTLALLKAEDLTQLQSAADEMDLMGSEKEQLSALDVLEILYAHQRRTLALAAQT